MLAASKNPRLMDTAVVYDGDGNRVSETVGGTWTPSFYGYDGHGNVRFLENSSGTVGNTYTFDAFGTQIASTGTTANNFLYSGEWLDPNLSLYNLRARYYNALTGRFETMDPGKESCCTLRASQVGNIFDPSTLHKYVYTANNPVNRVDPTGRDFAERFLLYDIDELLEFFLKRGLSKAAQAVVCYDLSTLYAAQNPDASVERILLYEAYCLSRMGE
jgi:RHS repeat-associated protein